MEEVGSIPIVEVTKKLHAKEVVDAYEPGS